uniref:PDZ domain-containing protein n=1 Tax=Pan troglodytes TaxID=9598 RepID=A0A2I3TBF5_PANTR
MSLYPSLEDLKEDSVTQAQTAFSANPANPAILSEAAAPISQDGNLYPKLYPEPSGMICMVVPVTENDAGIRRAEIKQGIREVILCKDQDGKIGLRLKSIDNDIFVQLVQANSPASLVGLRFGDQVLQISGENCFWREDYHDMTIRDRPFERTITKHKDSTGHVGFIFKNGKIVKNSSAARNGLLTEHNIYEINRQNVIGLKNSQIADILSTYGTVVTITIIREHIIKRMAPSIMKSLMDHTIPEV